MGFRTSLWCSGCLRHCPGCFNQEAQDPDFGRPFTEETMDKLIDACKDEWCTGLSLLGGEPFSICSDNRETMLRIVRKFKEIYPDKTIWAWSGYFIEELEKIPVCKEILNYVDVLVDGPFIEELKDPSLLWKGSSNQRVIDVQKWIKK